MESKNKYFSFTFLVLAFATISLAVIDAIIFIELAIVQDLTTWNVTIVVFASLVGMTISPMFLAVAYRIWLAKIRKASKEDADVKNIVRAMLCLNLIIIVGIAVFLTRERLSIMDYDRALYQDGFLESAGTFLHGVLLSVPLLSIVISFCFSLLHLPWERLYEHLKRRKEPFAIQELRAMQKKVQEAKENYVKAELDFRCKIDIKRDSMTELWIARLGQNTEIPFDNIERFKNKCQEVIRKNACRQAEIDFEGQLVSYYMEIEYFLFHLKGEIVREVLDREGIEGRENLAEQIKAIDIESLITKHNGKSFGVYEWNTPLALGALTKNLLAKLNIK